MDEQALQSIRVEYENVPLEREDLADDPIAQFSAWLEEAMTAAVPEPNAFVLSTADGTGRPSSRTLLLKGVDPTSLTFYTNYGSRKAEEIDVNPRVAALFLWLPQHRQVRIEGVVTRVSAGVGRLLRQSTLRLPAGFGGLSAELGGRISGGARELDG